MLAADAGLRRAEIAQVRGDDLIDDELGWSLIVHGKGAKDRIVPLSDELAREIRRHGPGWLFPGEKGCDHICGDTVYRLVKDATGYPPHSLRRRFATAAYITSNGNVMAIKELLGHESLATTQGYITVSGRMLRTVIEQARGYEARGTGDG
ncbi:tyrosine-type recombinase/integrase [Bifidobacterium rousetti]|nr:tyrosine-type recombinase/integrase [Bifidobacterium rousetti]